MSKEKDLLKIEKHYSDGTIVAIEKGLLAEFKADGKIANVEIEFLDTKSEDLYLFVMAALQLGYKMGMFDNYAKVEKE